MTTTSQESNKQIISSVLSDEGFDHLSLESWANCHTCDVPVDSDKAVRIVDRSFHPDCLKCFQCAKLLSVRYFHMSDGEVYCSTRCAINDQKQGHSEQTMNGNKNVMVIRKVNHDNHTPSENSFTKSETVEIEISTTQNGTKEHDRNGFSGNPEIIQGTKWITKELCKRCGNEFSTNAKVNARGNLYHLDCFRCRDCERKLNIWCFRTEGDALLCDPKCNNDSPNSRISLLKDPRTDPCLMCNDMVNESERPAGLKHPVHAKCFYCANCEKPLNPWKYTLVQAKPHCHPKCIVSSDKSSNGESHSRYPCHRCKKATTQGDRVTILNEFYHKNCFTCDECGRQLNIWKFRTSLGNIRCDPACKDDAQSPTSPKQPNETLCCHICDGTIESGGKITIANRCYHKECLKCHICGKTLNVWKFQEKDKRVSCAPSCLDRSPTTPSPKVQNNASNCYVCAKPVMFEFQITFPDGVSHDQCFKCATCNQKLTLWNYRVDDGKLQCIRKCRERQSTRDVLQNERPTNTCKGCQKPVRESDKLITLLGLYHRACFKCYLCGRTLNVWKHQIKDDKTCCNPVCPGEKEEAIMVNGKHE